MKSTLLLASIGMLAAVASTPSLAGTRESHSDVGSEAVRAVHSTSQDKGSSVSGRCDERADRHDRSDRRHDREQTRHAHRSDGAGRGMQAVPTNAGPGEPGHAWRYFSDAAAGRAVVISPQGEYFYGDGKALRLIAVTQARS